MAVVCGFTVRGGAGFNFFRWHKRGADTAAKQALDQQLSHVAVDILVRPDWETVWSSAIATEVADLISGSDIDVQLTKLDEDFKTGKISGDEYVEKRQNLKQTRNSLQEELHRMGVVT